MTKWINNRDIICGGFLAVFSTWFYINAQAIPTGRITGMPPSFFPSFLAVCLGICSVFLVGKGVMDVLRGVNITYEAKNNIKVLIIIASLFVYIFLFKKIGFIATTIIYLTAMMLLLRAGSIIKLASISVVMTLSIYLIFGKLFNIPLP